MASSVRMITSRSYLGLQHAAHSIARLQILGTCLAAADVTRRGVASVDDLPNPTLAQPVALSHHLVKLA